jgi:hypothetical protein
MTDDAIPAAELDAILAELEGAELEGAGLVEQYVNEAGEEAMRLTPGASRSPSRLR